MKSYPPLQVNMNQAATGEIRRMNQSAYQDELKAALNRYEDPYYLLTEDGKAFLEALKSSGKKK